MHMQPSWLLFPQQKFRTGILNTYESWRQNEEEKFWARQKSAYRLDVSTEESVGDLIDRSRHFTKILLQSRQDKPTVADTSVVSKDTGRPGPSCTTTQVPLLSDASTTPGTPPSLAITPLHPGYPPPYSTRNAISSNSSATVSTDDLNSSTTVPGLTSELSISVKDLEPIADSSSAPSPASADDHPSNCTTHDVTSVSEAFPATPPSDSQAAVIDADEREALLSQIEEITHTCTSQEGKGCSTCLFKDYQRLCVDALLKNKLMITDIADVVSLMGVFVPSRPTKRMKSVFAEEILQAFIKSGELTSVEWDSVEFDDSLAIKAVKC